MIELFIISLRDLEKKLFHIAGTKQIRSKALHCKLVLSVAAGSLKGD